MDDSGKISKGLISFVELLFKLYGTRPDFKSLVYFEILIENAYEEYVDWN